MFYYVPLWQAKKAELFPLQQKGNPAVSEMQELGRDPWLSVPVSQQVWLFQSCNNCVT